MKVDVPLSVRPYVSPFSSLGKEILNNFIVELAANETARSKYYYIGIPGLKLFKKTSTDLFPASNACRGLYTTTNNKTYGVFGKYVVEVTANGSYLLVGELKTYSGKVNFCDNGYTVLIVDGFYGYTIETDSNQLYNVTDEAFPGVEDPTKGPSHCVCIDSYFICNSVGTNKYYWSAPNYIPYAFDSTQPSVETLWNALDYGEKMGDSDNIVALIATVDLLWVIGSQSIEVHRNQNTGSDSQGQIFGRMDNALINFGCVAPNSVVKYGNNIYWAAQDKTGTVGLFTADTSFQPKRISTRGVETRIQTYSTIADINSYVFSHNGHTFIVNQFPNGTPTDDESQVTGASWVYDLTTDTWTRRTFWEASSNTSYMWRGMYCTYNFGSVLLGDRLTNAIYKLDSEYHQNDNPDGIGINQIQREFTTPDQNITQKNVVYRSCQLNMQQGVGLTNPNEFGIGEDPMVGMSYSNDTGNTWKGERLKPIGKIGEYANRTRWTSCGTGRNRVWKFRITAPVFIAVVGLTLDLEALYN